VLIDPAGPDDHLGEVASWGGSWRRGSPASPSTSRRTAGTRPRPCSSRPSSSCWCRAARRAGPPTPPSPDPTPGHARTPPAGSPEPVPVHLVVDVVPDRAAAGDELIRDPTGVSRRRSYGVPATPAISPVGIMDLSTIV
jgi:hypothetical protein